MEIGVGKMPIDNAETEDMMNAANFRFLWEQRFKWQDLPQFGTVLSGLWESM